MNRNAELTLQRATLDDIPTIQDIIRQATAVKAANGDDIWSEMHAQVDKVRGYIEDGLFLAYLGDSAVGSVILAESDERMWGEAGADNTALYVHKLARVSPSPIDRLGARILDLSQEHARAMGRNAIRLDCESDNEGLVNYYGNTLGFDVVGTTIVDSESRGRYEATLFERRQP